jgi:hypothetical protein
LNQEEWITNKNRITIFCNKPIPNLVNTQIQHSRTKLIFA